MCQNVQWCLAGVICVFCKIYLGKGNGSVGRAHPENIRTRISKPSSSAAQLRVARSSWVASMVCVSLNSRLCPEVHISALCGTHMHLPDRGTLTTVKRVCHVIILVQLCSLTPSSLQFLLPPLPSSLSVSLHACLVV